MKEVCENNKGGVGFISLLSLLFIGLKLGKVITWSWIWVLAPLWVPTGLAIGILLLILMVGGFIAVVKK